MYNNIFDSHAHYDDKRFKGDRHSLLCSLKENGVVGVTNIGCDMKSSHSSVDMASKYDFVYATVGIHPHDAKSFKQKDLLELQSLTKEKKVVAIGEIGLDYHYDFSPRAEQQKTFEAQLEMATDLDIPVVIHSREATQDVMNLLEKYRPKGVVHCFSGSVETAQAVLALGMYIGFTGVVTFPSAKKIQGVIDICPLDRMLIETDCPYMAPTPFRGQRCDSTMLGYVAEKIADVKGLDPCEVINSATENTKKVYEIV